MNTSVTVDFASKPVQLDNNSRPGVVAVVRTEGTMVLHSGEAEREIGFIRALSIPTQAMNESLVGHMIHNHDFDGVVGLLMSLSEHGLHKALHRLEIYSSHIMLVSAVGVEEEFQGKGYGRVMFEWMSRVYHDPVVLLEAEPMVVKNGELINHRIDSIDDFRDIKLKRDRLHKFYESIGLGLHGEMDHVFIGRVQRHKAREDFVQEAWA